MIAPKENIYSFFAARFAVRFQILYTLCHIEVLHMNHTEALFSPRKYHLDVHSKSNHQLRIINRNNEISFQYRYDESVCVYILQLNNKCALMKAKKKKRDR